MVKLVVLLNDQIQLLIEIAHRKQCLGYMPAPTL